jgi:LacI family transcriptional regulator
MKTRPNVALIVETSVVYGRQILHGVAQYMRMHGDWSVFLDERELGAPPPHWLADWKGNGIICRSTTPLLAAQFLARHIPVVDLNDQYGNLGLPRVSSDMRAIGRAAAQHLLDRGFKNVAFCGFSSEAWSKLRCEGVIEALKEGGTFCGTFESGWEDLRSEAWEGDRDRLIAWLEGLPRPLGIVACNDVRGHHVLEACRFQDIAVPQSVAVVGVDNARTICEMCSPPLSSVIPDAELIGYEAAALLDKLMSQRRSGALNASTVNPHRQQPAAFPIVGPNGYHSGKVVALDLQYPPKGIMARQSTDTFAVENPMVAQALWFIRNHACDGISVDDVIRKIPSSRSSLERSFRQGIGHSPQEEIRRVRIKRVTTLLEETEYSLARIAEISGFKYPEYMMVQFKRMTGQTPSQWRQKARAENAEQD